jgi:hypothetical protein
VLTNLEAVLTKPPERSAANARRARSSTNRAIVVDYDVLTDAKHEQKIVMLTTDPGSEA